MFKLITNFCIIIGPRSVKCSNKTMIQRRQWRESIAVIVMAIDKCFVKLFFLVVLIITLDQFYYTTRTMNAEKFQTNACHIK